MAEEFIIIDKVEDDSYEGKPFKKVTDKTGKVWKIKGGRGGSLQAKWNLLIPGRGLKLTIDYYNNKPFVADFALVENLLQEKAIGEIQDRVKTDTDTSKTASIERQVCLKCSCDISPDGNEIDKILAIAERMYQWLSGKEPSPAPIVAPVVSKEAPHPAEVVKDTKQDTTPPDYKHFQETATIMAEKGVTYWKDDQMLARFTKDNNFPTKYLATAWAKMKPEQQLKHWNELKSAFEKV